MKPFNYNFIFKEKIKFELFCSNSKTNNISIKFEALVDDFDYFKVVEILSHNFIKLKINKEILRIKTNVFVFKIEGKDEEYNIKSYIADKSISINDNPAKIFSYIAYYMQQALYNPIDCSFYLKLLLDEKKHCSTNYYYLPHNVVFFDAKEKMNKDVNLDETLVMNIIKNTEKANMEAFRYGDIISELKIRLEGYLAKTNTKDNINLIFGNYNEVSNIYAAIRIYVLGQKIINF
jgi:hypothetical protein